MINDYSNFEKINRIAQCIVYSIVGMLNTARLSMNPEKVVLYKRTDYKILRFSVSPAYLK